MQPRYYDADTGRFFTRDIVADTNLYIYADNNPVNFVDPDGRVPIPLIIFLAKAGFKAYTAYSTYKAIKNDPSMKNILLSLMPGGKITRMGGKKILRMTQEAKKGKSTVNFKSLRKAAVRNAWKLEVNLVKRTGTGTRNWTKSERNELLTTGKVKGYEGYHINNVANYPSLAGDPRNIKFVKGRNEHLREHGGNWKNPTSGSLINR